MPLKAIKWLLMRHGPLVIRPIVDPAMWAWVLQDAAQLHLGALCGQQGAHGADRRIQPRLPARAARRRPASPMTSAARARCSSSAPTSSSTGSAGDVEVLKQFGVPFEVLDPAGCIAAEPALAQGAAASSSAGCGCPATRPATARCSRRGSPRMRPARGVRFRFGATIERILADGGRILGVGDQRRHADRRCLCGGAWQLFADDAARRSASASRSIRSRAIRSPCRSRDPGGAPASTVMDETYKVAITRLGQPHPRRRHGRDLRLRSALCTRRAGRR